MKKVITIVISCSLALAASVIAQQDEQQQKPRKEKQPAKSQPASEAKPAPKLQQSVPRQHAETKAPEREKAPQSNESTSRQHAETKGSGYEKGQTDESTSKPHVTKPHVTKAPEKERGNANVGREQTEQRKKERGATNESETANKPPGPAGEREQSSAATAPQANKPNAQANKLNAQKRPDAQAVQRIKTQHASFRAQPKPDKVPPVTFNQGRRISGSQQWQGPQYQVFRSYNPEWHDRNWYHSHFNRVELIGGGYYYWNNGYWFPAWGYDPSAQYYAYDAPIYVGSRAEPPDRVIANVQATLQEMGYYQGEVDGLLGPLTRQALTAYQADHGLYATAVIDEPTLSALGMS